jgi:hypothetical protein
MQSFSMCTLGFKRLNLTLTLPFGTMYVNLVQWSEARTHDQVRYVWLAGPACRVS